MTRKYCERDITENLELARRIANAYVRAYTGNFRFLRECAFRLRRGQKLTVSMIRGVHNCILTDMDFNPANLLPYANNTNPFTDMPTLHAVRTIKLPTTWRKTYGYSLHVKARTIHRVALDSHLEYDKEARVYRPRIRWCCKSFYSMPYDAHIKIKLLTHEEAKQFLAVHTTFYACPSCSRLNL